MTATKSDIERWLDSAIDQNASHLIVAVDRYDHDNYPVYVSRDEDIRKEIERVESASMQGIDEIYNMSMSIEEQLNEYRAYNI